MKAKNGISLIVLVITIVVIIILAAAVILSLGDNNPINNSKVAQLTQTRDNIESAVQIYLSNEFTKCQGDYSAEQIIKGDVVSGGTYTANAIVTSDAVTVDSVEYFLLDAAAAKSVLGVDLKTNSLDTEAQAWYVNPKTGKAFVVFKSMPGYAYANGKDGDLNASVAGFVAVTTK